MSENVLHTKTMKDYNRLKKLNFDSKDTENIQHDFVLDNRITVKKHHK